MSLAFASQKQSYIPTSHTNTTYLLAYYYIPTSHTYYIPTCLLFLVPEALEDLQGGITFRIGEIFTCRIGAHSPGAITLTTHIAPHHLFLARKNLHFA